MTETASESRLPSTGTLVLIAVVLLIGGGVLMLWLPYHWEQQAIAEIERLGGSTDSEIIRPFWIPDAVDDDYLWLFERVTVVNLAESQISDADLGHLKELANLEELCLINTQVSDAGLHRLDRLHQLTDLYLFETQVTEVGVKKLQESLPKCVIEWEPSSE